MVLWGDSGVGEDFSSLWIDMRLPSLDLLWLERVRVGTRGSNSMGLILEARSTLYFYFVQGLFLGSLASCAPNMLCRKSHCGTREQTSPELRCQRRQTQTIKTLFK